MHLLGLHTTTPKNSFTQLDCLSAMKEAPFWQGLNSRSQWVLEKVLDSDAGIAKRHFALDDLFAAWDTDAEKQNNMFEKQAPLLATEAILGAVEKAGVKIEEVDALLLCTCTGFLCPGVTSYVAEMLGMRDDALLQDMTGLGCGAAVPLMRMASGLIAENKDAVVVTVAVEICSAAFYVEDDFGVLISTCIFGDGAAASVWSGKGGDWKVDDFKSLHVPEEREKIRFTNAGGRLRNQLEKTVPKLAGEAAARLYAKHTSEGKSYEAWLTHGGGKNVIQELEKQIAGLPENALKYAKEVMNDYGNMSSPSVLFALDAFFNDQQSCAETNTAWLCSFGAGFSAHSCSMSRV